MPRLKKSVKETKKTGAVAKPEKIETPVKKVESKKRPNTAKDKLTVDVFDITGKVADKIALPKEIFGVKINKVLIAQAIRVYRVNQRLGTSSTKTRGEVEGSSRKIYRQKGTGRARHGSIRAPIFRHGGIVFGPKPRDYSLKISKKMRRGALFSALTAKLHNEQIKIIQGLEKIEPKTKNFIKIIENLGLNNKKKKLLLITSSEIENLKRAARNVEGVSITAAQRLNTYEVLNNRQILFMKEAINELEKQFLEKTKKIKNQIAKI